MRSENLIIFTVLTLLLLVFTSCEEESNSPSDETTASDLIGTWEPLPQASSNSTLKYLTFSTDGTISFLHEYEFGLHETFEGFFCVEGDLLLLSGGIVRFQLNDSKSELTIACEPGDSIWFTKSEEYISSNYWTPSLVHVDDYQLDLATIEPYYMEYDGENFWSPSYHSYAQKVLIYSTTGDSVGSRPFELSEPFTFGDGYCWMLQTNMIYKIDMDTGERLDSVGVTLDPLYSDYAINSIVYDDGTMWLSMYYYIQRVNLETGANLATFETCFNYELTMVNDHLMALNGHYLLDIDKQTGQILTTYSNPDNTVYTLAWDGYYLYSLDYGYDSGNYVLFKYELPE